MSVGRERVGICQGVRVVREACGRMDLGVILHVEFPH